jgi:DNA topoisomerase-2
VQIKDFIKHQWKDYADYDNRRSLPHVMDGLKITQRKVMYTATKMPKGDKPVRVSQFASKAAELTVYHHGEQSMVSTVVNMAQDFPFSNNYPLMEKHGQFGTRLSNASAAPRYILTKLHENWNRFFKKDDQEIVEYLYDDEDQIEPKYFIPVLPTILLNGAEGMGNGFSVKILNYDVPDVAKAVREITKHGKVKTPLVPKTVGFNGTVEKVDRQVVFKGVLKIVHTTKLHITELPPGYDNEKYKTLLNKLIDSNLIKDYENRSTEDKWDFTINCPREFSALGHEVLMDKLGLIKRITENFVCWGMDDSAPMTFDGPEALVEYWYEERLKLYAKSLQHQIKQVKAHLIKLDLKIRFIRWCLKNDFRKLTKAEFIEQACAGVKRLTPEVASDFVSMPMYRITTDEVKKAELDIDNNIAILDRLEETQPLDLMVENLKGL